MAQQTAAIIQATLWAFSGWSNRMLNWSISFLAWIFHMPPCLSTVAFCCGVHAAVVMRRQPMSSSSFENSLSNSPPPSKMTRCGAPNGVSHICSSLANTTDGCLEGTVPTMVNPEARSTTFKKTSWLPA